VDEALTMPSAEDAAQLQLILPQCITEIDRLREIMRRDDVEIARSQARTRALLAEITAMQPPLEKFDNRRDRENAAHEHEKLLLRLEVALLRAERRTLTGRSDPGLLLEDTDEKPPEQ